MTQKKHNMTRKKHEHGTKKKHEHNMDTRIARSNSNVNVQHSINAEPIKKHQILQ